jgi:hypothetical protein
VAQRLGWGFRFGFLGFRNTNYQLPSFHLHSSAKASG